MEQVVKIAKIGESINSVDPNAFVFHSSYNTFKIVVEATKNITVAGFTTNQSFTEAHSQSFIPLVTAFAKRSGVSQVFLPNGIDIESWGAGAGWNGDITFNYIATDATNITFNFDNNGGAKDVTIKYYVLEKIN